MTGQQFIWRPILILWSPENSVQVNDLQARLQISIIFAVARQAYSDLDLPFFAKERSPNPPNRRLILGWFCPFVCFTIVPNRTLFREELYKFQGLFLFFIAGSLLSEVFVALSVLHVCLSCRKWIFARCWFVRTRKSIWIENAISTG